MKEPSMIDGIKCETETVTCGDGKKRTAYTFTVPGWDECTIIGLRAAKRVIHGRTDPAVLNTLGKKVY